MARRLCGGFASRCHDGDDRGGRRHLADGARAIAAAQSSARRIEVERGPKAYEAKTWLATSMPILLVESFYLLLTYTDVLLLKHFRSPEEIAVYYAAAKTLALVAFVNFSVSAAVAHRFTEYHVSGDRERLSAFLRDSIRWTFWPSLAATALILLFGKPFLWLFGPEFRRRLSGHVRARRRPAGARRGRAGRAAPQHARRAECLRRRSTPPRSCINLVGCLLLIPPLRRPRRGDRHLSALGHRIDPAVLRHQAPARACTSSSGGGRAAYAKRLTRHRERRRPRLHAAPRRRLRTIDAARMPDALSVLPDAARELARTRSFATSNGARSRRCATIAPQWRALAANALEPNIFYEPAFALAAAPVFGRGAGAVLVWSDEPQQRLLGSVPGAVERRRYGAAFAAAGWLDASLRAASAFRWSTRQTPKLRSTPGFDFIAQGTSLPRIAVAAAVSATGRSVRRAGCARAHATRQGAGVAYDAARRALLCPRRRCATTIWSARSRRRSGGNCAARRKRLADQARRLPRPCRRSA